jgi:RNA polymerase sigma-19 factor, ECF subfamily
VSRADEQWLSRLFDESGRRLLRYLAARLKDGTDADDLAQEVYLRLLRADDVLFIQDPRSFALRVATNVAYEWGRLLRHKAVHTGTELLEEQVSAAPGPLEQVTHAQEMTRLSRALERLSPTRRAIVLLHKRDGLTYEQIAAHVGLSVAMVGKHLAKGLTSCQQFFADEAGREQTAKGRNEHD